MATKQKSKFKKTTQGKRSRNDGYKERLSEFETDSSLSTSDSSANLSDVDSFENVQDGDDRGKSGDSKPYVVNTVQKSRTGLIASGLKVSLRKRLPLSLFKNFESVDHRKQK